MLIISRLLCKLSETHKQMHPVCVLTMVVDKGCQKVSLLHILHAYLHAVEPTRCEHVLPCLKLSALDATEQGPCTMAGAAQSYMTWQSVIDSPLGLWDEYFDVIMCTEHVHDVFLNA